MQRVMVRKLDSRAVLPRFATAGSAGADLYALLDEEVRLLPLERARIPTGLALGLPEGWVGLVYARSGMALSRGLALANGVGVIDADYRGELQVAVINLSNEEQVIAPGERIAQLMVLPLPAVRFEETDALDETARGTGGFGSTGSR